jgi:methyl-accepting chemotaxis protein
MSHKINHQIKSLKNNFLSSKKIRTRIILFFLFVSLVPICVIGSLSYISFRATITKKTAQYSLDLLTQTVSNIQLKLAEFENISVRLFINKEFNDILGNYVSVKDGTSLQKKIIEDYFNEYMISNKDVFAFMFICNSKNEKSIVITKDYYQDFLNLTRHFRETYSYQSIVKAGGGIVWSSTIKLNGNHFVILGRYIKDLTTGEPLGILAIVVDEDKIDQLANQTIYNQLNISFNELESYSFIINNDGEIVSSPFKEEIGKNVTQIMKETKPLRPILGNLVSNRDYGSEINQGSFITEVNKKQMLVTYKSIGSKIGVGGKSGWNLLSLAPTAYLYQEVSSIGLITLVIGIAFVILAIFLSFYVANLIKTNNINNQS